MKKFLKVLGIVVGAIALIIILALAFTSGLIKSTTAMFNDIKQGNIEQAYVQTSQEFQAATSLEQFQTFLTESNLKQYQKAIRNERSVTNNQGLLKGTVTTTDEGKIPLEITLIKESGKWKIYSMNILQGGILDQTDTKLDIPSQQETVLLVQKNMGIFTDAIQQGDFGNFYNSISTIWQQQTNKDELQEAFQAFIDNEIDLSFTKVATPIFANTPTIDEYGILTVQGAFEVTDGQVTFEHKFYKESGERKLFGINVQIQ